MPARRVAGRTLAVLAALLLSACSSPGPASSTRSPHAPTTVTSVTPRTEPHGPTTIPPATTPTTGPPAPVAPATPDQLTTVAFLNTADGYALYRRQNSSGCQTVFGRTVDGGSTFSGLVPVTSFPCSSTPVVSQIAFDDRGDGFLYGPGLYVSHDGGAAWSDVAQPGHVLAVEALGPSIWMVETDCPAAGFNAFCPMRLVESDDGGRTWGAATGPTEATMDNGYSASSGQTWLVRLTTDAAYLATNVPFSQDQSAPLWYTNDAGRTWEPRIVDCGMSAMTIALSAAPDGTLFGVCAGQPGAGSQVKSTVRSMDGGFSWTTMTPCPPPRDSEQFDCFANQRLSAGYLGEIDAVSDDTIYLAGDRSSLLVTHDAGVSWAPVSPSIGDTSDGTWKVTFFNQSDGFVLGNDPRSASNAVALWWTSDGGTTWHPEVPVESAATTRGRRVVTLAGTNVPPGPAGPFGVTTASFLSEQVGWVLGVTSCRAASHRWCAALAHTTDGGNTWTSASAPPAPVTASTPTGITQLHFANEADAYAYGGSGLWVTHDGGARWRFLADVAGIRSELVGSVVTNSSDVFATLEPRNGDWRLAEAPLGSDDFHVLRTLGGGPGAPPLNGLTTAGGVVYVLDGAFLLRVEGTAVSVHGMPPGQECNEVTASTANAVLLECGSGVADGAMGDRELFGSADGGGTWVRLPDPGQGEGYDDLGSADGGDGHAVLSTVGGGGSSLLVTTDYGLSWTSAIGIGNGYGGPFVDPSYQDPFDAVVVYDPAEVPGPDGAPQGQGELFRSTDAGLTWNRVRVSLP